MALFLDEKLSDKSMVDLESTSDITALKKLIAEIFKVNFSDKRKQCICVDFYVNNYLFCKERAFNLRATSTMLSIMNEVFLRDASAKSRSNTMAESFSFFQTLLKNHSVFRPPKSILVFDQDEALAVLDFATDSYFRQFRLFKYIFGTKTRVIIKQTLPHEVETPKIETPPLSLALYREVATVLPSTRAAADDAAEAL